MTTPSPVQQNRFRDCTHVPELVGQTVGAGSSPALWEGGTVGVFRDGDARAVVEDSLAHLRLLLVGKILAQGYTAEHAVAQADYLLAE